MTASERIREARVAREIVTGTIQLVDYRDRTVATLPLHCQRGRVEGELHSAIGRWRKFEVDGGYARDDSGSMLTYA